MQWSSRIHIKVKSPKVWEKLADIDLNRYYIQGKGKDIFPKNSTSFIINGDWECAEGKLVSLVKKIVEILKNECIIIADCTNIDAEPYSCIVYYFGNEVHTPSYSVLSERWYSRKVRKEKGKLWELHFNANINDITEYINYNLFFPREIDRIEGEQLRDFGINIEKFYVFDKELVHYCGNNSAISIPNGVEKIHDSLFLNCDWIEKVYIPEGINEIKNKAFANCKSLREVNIPDSLIKIGKDVFSGCKYLDEKELIKEVKKNNEGKNE